MSSLHRPLFKLLNIRNSYYIDKFSHGFPDELRNDVCKVIHLIPKANYNNLSFGTSKDFINYKFNTTAIMFPYRMYFQDVPDNILNTLNEQQRMILHCMYSRNSNGYVRQKHIEALLCMEYCDWAIPYVVKVCDEYVVEILEMVYELLRAQDTERFKRFCLNNSKSFVKSHCRMVSYWNCFYRHRYPKFRKYIGRKLFRECFGYTRSLEKADYKKPQNVL